MLRGRIRTRTIDSISMKAHVFRPDETPMTFPEPIKTAQSIRLRTYSGPVGNPNPQTRTREEDRVLAEYEL